MSSEHESGPGLASAQAQQVLQAPWPSPPDLDPQSMTKLRAEICAGYQPVIDRAVNRSGVAITEAVIADVPCLQVSPPDQTVNWPILYGFGGGFITGSPEEDLIIAAPLAARTGAKVVIPRYRLAPEHPWPAAIDDGFAVYRTLATDPFALVGESAGGNMAMALMLRARAAGLALPGAAALLSPWCDLTGAGDSLAANNGRDPTLTQPFVDDAAKMYFGDNSPKNPDISPIYGKFDPAFPPTIITTGTRDLLLSHGIRAAQILRKAGVDVSINIWDDLWHVFEFDDRLPEAADSIAYIAEFVGRHMVVRTP